MARRLRAAFLGPLDVKADDGVRTRDLRFTKPLLYRLSYVGAKPAKHGIPRRFTQARSCSRFAVRSDCGTPRGTYSMRDWRPWPRASRRYAATEEARMSRQFPAAQCAREFCLARLRSARSVHGRAQS